MKVAFRTFIESFQFLIPSEIDIIVEHTELKSFKKGTILLKEGAICKECYAIVKGCVREYYLVEGQEKTTAFFIEGAPVNSFSSYQNQIPSKHFLICVEDCILTVGNQSLVDEMCERIPRLSDFIRGQVEKDAGALQERMASYMTSTPEQRLLNLMETTPSLINRVPQHQIASYLGITPESLSRIKKRLMKNSSN